MSFEDRPDRALCPESPGRCVQDWQHAKHGKRNANVGDDVGWRGSAVHDFSLGVRMASPRVGVLVIVAQGP